MGKKKPDWEEKLRMVREKIRPGDAAGADTLAATAWCREEKNGC